MQDGLLHKRIGNLCDVEDVHGVGRIVPLGSDFGEIQKVCFFQRGLEHGAALQYQLCVLECHIACGGGHGLERGVGHLVHIPSGVPTAEDQILAVSLRHEREGELLLLVHEACGVAVGADEDIGYGAVPEEADATPAGRHAVEAVRRAGGDEHPLLADEFRGRDIQRVDVDAFHGVISAIVGQHILQDAAGTEVFLFDGCINADDKRQLESFFPGGFDHEGGGAAR